MDDCLPVFLAWQKDQKKLEPTLICFVRETMVQSYGSGRVQQPRPIPLARPQVVQGPPRQFQGSSSTLMPLAAQALLALPCQGPSRARPSVSKSPVKPCAQVLTRL